MNYSRSIKYQIGFLLNNEDDIAGRWREYCISKIFQTQSLPHHRSIGHTGGAFWEENIIIAAGVFLGVKTLKIGNCGEVITPHIKLSS